MLHMALAVALGRNVGQHPGQTRGEGIASVRRHQETSGKQCLRGTGECQFAAVVVAPHLADGLTLANGRAERGGVVEQERVEKARQLEQVAA